MCDYMAQQPSLNPGMRAILVDWLVEVQVCGTHQELCVCVPETIVILRPFLFLCGNKNTLCLYIYMSVCMCKCISDPYCVCVCVCACRRTLS